MNNLEETNRKDIIVRWKEDARNLWEQQKIAKRNLLEWHKVKISNKKYRYLEWTEGRDDNGKECTSTERKTGRI